jgi:hypothetical protein
MHVFLIVVAIIAFIGVCALASWTRAQALNASTRTGVLVANRETAEDPDEGPDWGLARRLRRCRTDC